MIKSLKNKMEKPVWLKYTEQEVKNMILEIAKKNPGFNAEKIGLVLRDTYGIPKMKIYGIKIGGVLKEEKIYKNPEKENLKEKIKKLEKHLERNKKDNKTKRSLIISKAKLKKVEEYLAKKSMD